MVNTYRNSAKQRLRSRPPFPQTSRMSNNAGEGHQTVGRRISVKDRLGPLPNVVSQSSAFKRRRGRSVEGKNARRGRKFSKPVEEEEPVEFENLRTARIPVHERLGALPPQQQQSFKRSDQLFHKRNRQQVWKHQDYKDVPQQQSKERFIPETENVKPSFVKPPAVPAVPSVPPRVLQQPFNAEQHRQAWTWVRPSLTNSSAAAMDVDESDEKASS